MSNVNGTAIWRLLHTSVHNATFIMQVLQTEKSLLDYLLDDTRSNAAIVIVTQLANVVHAIAKHFCDEAAVLAVGTVELEGFMELERMLKAAVGWPGARELFKQV